jgi:hypothetical protein
MLRRRRPALAAVLGMALTLDEEGCEVSPEPLRRLGIEPRSASDFITASVGGVPVGGVPVTDTAPAGSGARPAMPPAPRASPDGAPAVERGDGERAPSTPPVP